MKKETIDLRLFDGDVADAVTGEEPGAGDTHRPSGDAGAEAPDESDPAAGDQTEESDAEARRRAFLALVNGAYKDVYTKETQRIINGRFKEAKLTEKRLAEAERTIEELRRGAEASAKTASAEQTAAWRAEAEAVRQRFPGFDFEAEMQNERFAAALRAGLPVAAAYAGLHFDELNAAAVANAVSAAQKNVVDHILARGQRPRENGTAAAGVFTVRADPSRMTRADREEIERRVRRGEEIVF